jgi:hypothetical protein
MALPSSKLAPGLVTINQRPVLESADPLMPLVISEVQLFFGMGTQLAV